MGPERSRVTCLTGPNAHPSLASVGKRASHFPCDFPRLPGLTEEPVLLIKAADVKGQMKKKAVEGTVGALAAQAEIHEEKRRSLREQLEENLSEAQKAAVAKQFAAETKKTSTRERSRLRRFASRDGSVTSMFSSLDSQRNKGEPKEEAQTSAVGRPKARVQLFSDKT